jgi:hypothetical protein
MIYSVQQIKFEFLSYIKEFGGNAEEWRIGFAEDARRGLFELNGVNETNDIWIWKPALTSAAARNVHDYFTDRFRMPTAVLTEDGNHVFLFKRSAGMAAAIP